jgi:hypothetical protein
LLKACNRRESVSSAQDDEFSFVTDDKIRAVLKDYWSQAKTAFNATSYAGVVVLCGGVLEGLLAWALTSREDDAREKCPGEFQKKDGTQRPISDWDLTSLINVTKKLEIIGETSERLLRAVQGFRNFIHPYNVIQRSARPDKRLATISLETVGEVARSVQGRLSTP